MGFLDPRQILKQTIFFRQEHKIFNNNGLWQLIGPISLPKQRTNQPNGLGRVNAIVFDPNNFNTFYLCTASGGFWRTRDYGQTWEYLSVSLPTLGTSDAIVDPYNSNIIYLATGDRDGYDAKGLGIWKTTDGGITWQSVLDTTMTVNMLIMDPTNNQKIIAGATFGIFLTENAGQTWNQTLSNIRIKDLEFHPTNPNIVYATGEGLLFISHDGGYTWTDITNKLNLPVNSTRNVLGVSPASPDWLYVVATNDNDDYSSPFLGVYLSTDAGETFTLQTDRPNLLGYKSDGSDNGSQAWYDLCIAVSPENANIVYVGGVNIWKSINAGESFVINAHWVGSGAPAVHADHHDLRFAPDNITLFSANDGGINYQVLGTNDWINLTNGLSIAQVYRIGSSSTKPFLIMHGYQDNGTALSYDIDNFYTVIGGDGMECLIDYSSDDYKFGELYFGDIRRSINDGNFSSITSDINETGYWVTPYVQNPKNPLQMLAGYINLWQTDNLRANTVSWEKLTDFTDESQIIALEYCLADPKIVYFSKRNNTLYRIDNLGQSNPVDLTSNLPYSNLYITSIETDEQNTEIVYIVAYDRVNRRGVVLKSNNKGQNWEDITNNLPVEFFNTIVQDTSSQLNQLYLGTFTGVYTINDSLNAWVDYSNQLPITDVRELEIFYGGDNPANRHIKAATYGRGTWYSPLFVENNLDAAISIKKSKTYCFRDPLEIYLANLGMDTVQKAKICIYLDNQPIDTIEWTGKLGTYESEILYLNGIFENTGNYNIKARLIEVNNQTIDENLKNNYSNTNISITLNKTEYKQTFIDSKLPQCWTIKGENWTLTNNNEYSFNSKTHTNGFLLYQKNDMGEDSAFVETCGFDLSNNKNVYLKFEQLLKLTQGIARIDYSVDGKNWSTIVELSGNRGNEQLTDIFLISLEELAGKPLVYFRFMIKSQNTALWAIDDFLLSENLEDNFITDAVLIYPNPATDKINISFRNNYSKAQLRLINIQGKVLIQKEINNPQFESININDLRPGIYLIEVILPDQKYSKQVLKK